MLAGLTRVEPAELDPRVGDVLAKNITVDLHTHAGFEEALKTGTQPPVDVPGEMKRAGLTAISLTSAVDSPLMGPSRAPGTRSSLTRDPKPGEMYANHVQALSRVDQLLARTGLSRALKLADLRAAHDRGGAIVIQDAEGADFLEGRLERIQETYRRGTRILQLVHYAFNDVGDFQSGPNLHGGLSSFGARVIQECNRLGMVVDVAHGTQEMVKGAVRAARQPLILSHTAVRGSAAQGSYWAENFTGGMAMMSARQVTPDHARAVAETGGVIGLWHLFSSGQKWVEGIREMVDLVGVEHVGIGTDTGIGTANRLWPGQDNGLMFTLIGEMLKQGFTPEECGKIAGGNFCRVFDKCTRVV